MKTFIKLATVESMILAALILLGSQAPALAAGDWTFENAHLGEGFRTFVGNTRFTPPCDVDPINDSSRTVAFFTAKLCRGNSFPEKTTVVLFTASPVSETNGEASVNTVAWMGGTYFDTRSNFPLRIGASAEEATQVLGGELESGSIRRKNVTLRIVRHPESVYSMSVEGRTVGFVVGDMPPIVFGDSPGSLEGSSREEWKAVVAGYFQFTLTAGNGTPEELAPPATPAVDPVAAVLIDEFFRGRGQDRQDLRERDG